VTLAARDIDAIVKAGTPVQQHVGDEQVSVTAKLLRLCAEEKWFNSVAALVRTLDPDNATYLDTRLQQLPPRNDSGGGGGGVGVGGGGGDSVGGSRSGSVFATPQQRTGRSRRGSASNNVKNMNALSSSPNRAINAKSIAGSRRGSNDNGGGGGGGGGGAASAIVHVLFVLGGPGSGVTTQCRHILQEFPAFQVRSTSGAV
jgi:hypothetical protein